MAVFVALVVIVGVLQPKILDGSGALVVAVWLAYGPFIYAIIRRERRSNSARTSQQRVLARSVLGALVIAFAGSVMVLGVRDFEPASHSGPDTAVSLMIEAAFIGSFGVALIAASNLAVGIFSASVAVASVGYSIAALLDNSVWVGLSIVVAAATVTIFGIAITFDRIRRWVLRPATLMLALALELVSLVSLLLKPPDTLRGTCAALVGAALLVFMVVHRNPRHSMWETIEDVGVDNPWKWRWTVVTLGLLAISSVACFIAPSILRGPSHVGVRIVFVFDGVSIMLIFLALLIGRLYQQCHPTEPLLAEPNRTTTRSNYSSDRQSRIPLGRPRGPM